MSTPRTGILGGGNWIVDAVKIIDVFPQQDALANILSESKGSAMTKTAGGSWSNAAPIASIRRPSRPRPGP
jgi:hypothetical protein